MSDVLEAVVARIGGLGLTSSRRGAALVVDVDVHGIDEARARVEELVAPIGARSAVVVAESGGSLDGWLDRIDSPGAIGDPEQTAAALADRYAGWIDAAFPPDDRPVVDGSTRPPTVPDLLAKGVLRPDQVALVVVVAEDAAAVLARLGAPRNSEVDTEEVWAIVRSWERRYGALAVTSVMASGLDLVAAKPPTTWRDARVVAAEQLAICGFIGASEPDVLRWATELVPSGAWSFWW
jgi:hypothetical protein